MCVCCLFDTLTQRVALRKHTYVCVLSSAKVHRREEELNVVLQYIKETRSAELNSYTGNDVNHILQVAHLYATRCLLQALMLHHRLVP